MSNKSLTQAQLPPTDYCQVEGEAHTESARFELRSFDWSGLHEGQLIPPSSYLELTNIHAEGRYDKPSAGWQRLGSVRYHPAGNEFQCRWYEDSQVALLCAFNPIDALGIDADVDSRHLAKTHDLQNPYLLQLLTRAQQEIANPGLVSEVVLSSLGDAILSAWQQEFFEYLNRPINRKRGTPLGVKDIQRIKECLREQREIPSVEQFARELGISHRQFSRLFKEATGQSLAEVFKQQRLQRANELLANKQLLIKEVAYLCGFESAAAFSKSFRASMGFSPQQYRQSLS